jgi:hypothetical protein
MTPKGVKHLDAERSEYLEMSDAVRMILESAS